MPEQTEKVYFNFSYSALSLLGHQMYTNKWSAISELVANGLDAGAKTVKIYINSVDKKNSTIEIFDDGSGMDQFDLVNKYTLIGRNRRQESTSSSEKIKGRKGVGKLAALFLSKKYYIITKKEGKESAWLLDSNNVNESDIPSLNKVNNVEVENYKLWNEYTQGTMIKLMNVDMSNFANQSLKSLKMKIADYYLLDKIDAKIEICYLLNKNDPIKYEVAKKETAFKNFYAFYETVHNLKSYELRKTIPIKLSKNYLNKLQEKFIVKINSHERNVVVLTPQDISTKILISGERDFKCLDGGFIRKKFNLDGWIGIHSTINSEDAKSNDQRFIKNSIYNPNRLKLYVREKLAVADFLGVINNSQAFANYIEGEISFDILDDSDLPDISSTSREGLAIEDERVELLISLISPIINRLIRERTAISKALNEEAERKISEEFEREKKARELERIEKEKERKEKEIEIATRKKAEQKSNKLTEENTNLKSENNSLKNQNNMKDILLNESDPVRQKLLVHELTVISTDLNYTIEDIMTVLFNSQYWEEILPYIKHLKKYVDKLNTIKQQFLKLNNYDIIGKQTIDLKAYLRSYLQTINIPHVSIIIEIDAKPFMSKVEIFEIGVLIDYLISNASEKNATYIKFTFLNESNILVISSDTGPVEITPVEKIFNLGVSSKRNGTGIGMFLVKEICEEYGWSISVTSSNEKVEFVISLEGVKR